MHIALIWNTIQIDVTYTKTGRLIAKPMASGIYQSFLISTNWTS